MNGKFQVVIFTIFLAVMVCLFRYCSGPFYFGNNSDPSYFYLYNFLYILEGKSPLFVDHPGTTLDILGALVIKIFFAPMPNTPWLLTNAAQAEAVLSLVWFFMIALYAATLMVLGFYAFKKSQDRIFTGLVLLSCLWLVMVRSYFAEGVLSISANVNSDTMMMTAVNVMLLAILRFYFSLKPQSCSHAISLGAVTAFAMATKFTALPFFVVAWCILVTWQQRILLVIVAAGGFVLLTCPIWGSYPQMISWLSVLILYRGLHGSGGQGFDGVKFLGNFWWVIKNYWFFVAGWFWAGGIAGKANPSIDSKIRWILGGFALGGLTQVIIVAKQPSYQYMAPMIGVSSLVLAFLFKAYPDWWRKGLKHVVIITLVVSLGMMAVTMGQVYENTRKTQGMLDTIARDYAQCWVCPFYRSSLQGFAFVFWNKMLQSEKYSSILGKIYPGIVYYDLFDKDFKDSTQQIVPWWVLKQQRSKVLLYGSDLDVKYFEPHLTVKKIYTNGGPEALYEVTSQRSNRAMEYLQLAMMLYKQGHYQDAFKAAVISQQLGVGQDISRFIEFLRKKNLEAIINSQAK